MSALLSMVERRRIAEGLVPNPFYGTNEQTRCLRVEDSAGAQWMLPWNNFVFGQHQSSEGHEELVLAFVAYEVAVQGRKLSEIFYAVMRCHLEWLRPAPRKYSAVAADEPAIERIEVRSLARPAPVTG